MNFEGLFPLIVPSKSPSKSPGYFGYPPNKYEKNTSKIIPEYSQGDSAIQNSQKIVSNKAPGLCVDPLFNKFDLR
jgi:hypothetical protein